MITVRISGSLQGVCVCTQWNPRTLPPPRPAPPPYLLGDKTPLSGYLTARIDPRLLQPQQRPTAARALLKPECPSLVGNLRLEKLQYPPQGRPPRILSKPQSKAGHAPIGARCLGELRTSGASTHADPPLLQLSPTALCPPNYPRTGTREHSGESGKLVAATPLPTLYRPLPGAIGQDEPEASCRKLPPRPKRQRWVLFIHSFIHHSFIQQYRLRSAFSSYLGYSGDQKRRNLCRH